MRIVTLTPTVGSHTELDDIQALGKKYAVQFFLGGSVRQSGDVFRINIHLIATETGQHIFSKSLDRQYTAANLFEVQEEIASHVAAAIAAPYGMVNRYNRREGVIASRSIPAYDAILKYYSMSLRPTPEKAAALLEEFEALSKVEQDHSSIWAIIAILNIFIVSQSMKCDNPPAYLEKAMDAAAKAATIDPQNALAFHALFLAYHHSGDVELGEKMLAKSLNLNPNDDAVLAYYAVTLAFRGKCAEAIAYLNAALELNPRPPKWYYLTTIICAFDAKKYGDVLELLGKTVEFQRMHAITMMHLSALGHTEQKDDVEPLLRDMRETFPNFRDNSERVMSYWSTSEALKKNVIEGWDKLGLD